MRMENWAEFTLAPLHLIHPYLRQAIFRPTAAEAAPPFLPKIIPFRSLLNRIHFPFITRLFVDSLHEYL